MKARMKDNLIERYEKALPEEIAAQEEGYKTIAFLRSIENQEVELVFTAGDVLKGRIIILGCRMNFGTQYNRVAGGFSPPAPATVLGALHE